jgi:hypothetical protein
MTSTTEQRNCEAECIRLSHDFAYFVDNRDYEKFVALFAEDGTFDRRGEVLRGREAIMKAMLARPADLITRHACTNIRIDLQADGTASGTGCMMLFHGSASGIAAGTSPSHSTTIAEYRDVYVSTPEGWRIRSRVTTIVF